MQAAQTSFISSTYWTEGVGPTAGLATVQKMQRVDVPAHVARIGERMRQGWLSLGERHALAVLATGHAWLLHLAFEHGEAAAIGTLFTAKMLDRGHLAGSGFYPSLAHEDATWTVSSLRPTPFLPSLPPPSAKEPFASNCKLPVPQRVCKVDLNPGKHALENIFMVQPSRLHSREGEAPAEPSMAFRIERLRSHRVREVLAKIAH